ncbi:MAG TPA: HAD-IA family hydrolase [Thermohalobaculum sp.]|nr:HAD-IA family hydrolase [Thermohalobaculum sp.]
MTALTIFDCDGVLVDSEAAANRVMVRMLGDIGFRIGLEDCMARFVGKSMATVQAEIEAEAGAIFPEGWPEAIRAHTIAELQRVAVPAIPGIQGVIQAHRAAGRPYCVASSGRIEKMRATLGGSGLLPLFEDVLFSATMVGRGKPAPDLFLHAAATLGHAPGNCTVIEDSLPGVQAAVAAGMPVFAYCAAPYADAAAYRALGARIFTDMSELPGLLDIAGAG